MKYFIEKRTGYLRTLCEKCAIAKTSPIKNEADRRDRCFECGQDKPIDVRGRFTKHRPDPAKMIGLVAGIGAKELVPVNVVSAVRLQSVATAQGIAFESERPVSITATFLPAWKRWAKEIGYTIVVTRKAVLS